MSRRRPVSEEERALWAGIARSVKPLRKAAAKAPPVAPKGEPAPGGPLPTLSPRPTRKAEAPRMAKSVPPALPLVALDRRLKQRVARGSQAIAARIDLHGMTQGEAHAALAGFLSRAQADGAKLALVVTGKGGSKSENLSAQASLSGQASLSARDGRERGVLRRQVPLWLQSPEFRRFVVGFDEAHRSHGGAGALYVRLRRPR